MISSKPLDITLNSPDIDLSGSQQWHRLQRYLEMTMVADKGLRRLRNLVLSSVQDYNYNQSYPFTLYTRKQEEGQGSPEYADYKITT